MSVSLGIDIGTTTICCIAVDARNGRVIKSTTLPNDTFLSGGAAWERAQDCKAILEKVLGLAEAYTGEFPDVVSIGITGQMHGIVYLDEGGKAVSPLYTWQDERGNQMLDGLTYAQSFHRASGYAGASGYGLVTHYYNRKNGLVPQAAGKLCTIQDFAAMCLCGLCAPVMHASDAASLGAFDLGKGRFDAAALENAGISGDILPEVTEDFQILGTYKGIPVSAAIGDNQASFWAYRRRISMAR